MTILRVPDCIDPPSRPGPQTVVSPSSETKDLPAAFTPTFVPPKDLSQDELLATISKLREFGLRMQSENDANKAKVANLEALHTSFWQGVLDDSHVNGSGLVLFGCLAAGELFPEQKAAWQNIAGYAATYLFCSAKKKTA